MQWFTDLRLWTLKQLDGVDRETSREVHAQHVTRLVEEHDVEIKDLKVDADLKMDGLKALVREKDKLLNDLAERVARELGDRFSPANISHPGVHSAADMDVLMHSEPVLRMNFSCNLQCNHIVEDEAYAIAAANKTAAEVARMAKEQLTADAMKQIHQFFGEQHGKY